MRILFGLLAAAAVAALIAVAVLERRTPTAQLVAAGDVASCASNGDERTARLLDGLPGTVAVLGDTVYGGGSDSDYRRCYEPTWGRAKARTRPAIGNHEYETPDGAGYFRYFGRAAGSRPGYYSYDLGEWHVVVLNTNCGIVRCERGSPQERWLREDLRRSESACTLAYGHHPRFSSGLHGSNASVDALWRALVEGGVDVALFGHDHHYERFAPLDANGSIDTERGIRQFIVGTGGRSHYPVGRSLPTSETHDDDTFGVLALDLRADSYRWRFVTVDDRVGDSGTGRCH